MACTYIYQGKKYNAWEFADVLASMPIDDLMKYLPGAVAAQLSEATQASRLGYDVQARKKAYTDDRQLQLFLDSEPDPSQTGPASDRARREAVAAVDDLRSTGTVLGQSLSGDYAARQRVSLVGQKVSGSEELAILAQVYRDPRFETFRLVFTDDSGNVVSQIGLTSRLPASATAVIGDDVDAYLKDIAAAAKSTGATGFYMLHNHPSGLSKPSDADVSLTKMFAASMPGIAFQSHVVIDTNEYSVIDRDGFTSTEKKDFGQPKPFQDAEWGGLKIEGPADVMAMAKKLQVDDGAITLIHTNAQNQVKSITTIPESVAASKRAAQHIARAALGQNGANLFAVGRSAAALGNIGGLVTDSILVSADGTVQSLRATGAIRGGNIYPARRAPRVSQDTSAAFDYLKRIPKGAASSVKVGEANSQYSETMPDTIIIDGVERQTRNSNGQQIHYTEDGIKNFWRWYDGLQQQRLDRASEQSGRGAGASGLDQRTAGRQGYFFDEQGRPRVFYHGTNADITTFDLDHKDKWDNGWLGRGVYLASDPELARFYAQQKGWQSNVMPLYAGVTNPYVFNLKEKQKLRNATTEEIKAITSRLQDNGYDGGVLEFGDGSLEVVAFNRNAVKSATGNSGTFDPANPDIRRSFAGQSSESKSTVAASRERLVEVFGKSAIQQLESMGLLNIAQSELEAIDRAAQMYAEATGQNIEDVRNSMLASVRMSRAWHGSPHRFDKFSLDHMGKGEGAQAYGWGLYFADKQDVAEWYRAKLSKWFVGWDGSKVDVYNPRHLAGIELFTSGGDREDAIESIELYLKTQAIPYEQQVAYREALNHIRNGTEAKRTKEVGQLYEVEIPSDDTMLLWDKPLSEQSEKVREALEQAIQLLEQDQRKILSAFSEADIARELSASRKTIDGETIYNKLSILFSSDKVAGDSNGEKAASKYLNSLGITGIKYLDGTSRGAGEGSFNYVIFNDADVQIIDVKYSADGKIQGFYVPKLGKAFVVADNVAAQDMPAVVAHEVGVHMAMDGNPAMEKLSKQAANLIKLGRGNPFFDRIRQRMNEAGETSNEEAMAYLAEEAKKARDRVPNTVKQWLKDVVAAVKSWLFRKGVLGANRMNENDILAVAMAYVKQAAEKKGDGQAKFSRTQWSNNFPDALILRRAEVVHAHPDYRAAKDGDTEAAKRLVQDIVTREDLLKISQLIGKGESLIVAVHAEEAAGKNKIPMAYASFIAEQLGKRLDLRIVQTKKVSRGGSDGMHRITTEVPFSGEVEPGGKYLIVDDTLTQGGTLADLKGYIEENGGVVVGASTLMGKQYSSKLKPSAETLKALRDRYGRDFENWWKSEFGYDFDRLTESEARYLAKIRGEDADTLRDRILAARQDGSGDVANGGVRQDATPADTRGTGSDSVKFSRSGGRQTTQTTTPPKETTAQAAQRKIQDKLNRFTVIKEWLAEQGIVLSELADVHKTEERMHSRFANKAEDFREKRVKPLVEKIQKAGFSMGDVAKFLHAQHAKERNDQIAKVNKNMPDGGSGMTNAEAAAILAASSPELAALANELRSITVDTKNILLNSGLISKDLADAWDGAYQYYVPLKGGPDDDAGGKGTGKGLSVREKQRRALGHEKREDDTREDGEWIIENILGDHERALMQAEKNRVFQALLKMAIETSPLNLITINKPEKRQILKNQASYVVRVKGRPVDSFTTKEAANLFKQSVALSQKGVSPADITIEKTYDQTVALMASPMPGPDEATGYVNGHMVRVQFNDDLLARAYNNMGAESLGKILQAGRALNNYFSKIYTGYNPEFLLVNVIRDFQTGLANTTGEEGIGMAMKAAKNYTMRFRDLFRYARTGNETQWIKMYREDGGNTGAAYLSDLERLGSEIQTEYKAFQGVAANLQKGDYKGAARAAMRKVFDRTLVYIEHVNQAGENAMRLAVYQAMIESGRSRREAASLAKNVTVNFNRKGELGAQANALYLFFNAGAQGTAAVAHAHFKGKHRMQAWGFSSALLGLGYLMYLVAVGADEEEYEKTSEYERSRNILIPTGDGFFKIPVAFGYGFFWNLGRSMAEAQRTGNLGKTPWHIASSFVEEFTPFGATMAGDGPDSEQAMLYSMPTVAQIVGAPVFNRTSMGIPMMPSSFSQYAHARDLMNNGTRGTWADDLAGLLEDVGMDVSPETLKHYGRTFTGGSGMLASSVVDGAKLKWEGAELEVSEIPFFRKLYTVPDVRGARARYYEAKSEAEKALADFKRAVKQGDMETANEIQAEQGELLALARLAANQKKRIKAARDRIDSIRLSGEYGKAAERHIIKNLEAEEAQIYDNYMAIFKARMGR